MRILAPLFFLGAAIAAWFTYQNWMTERQALYWATELKLRLEPLCGKKLAPSLAPDEKSVFQLLFFLNKATSAGREIDPMLDQACELLAIHDPARSIVKTGVTTNLDIARKFRLFEDIGNLANMESGGTPLIKSAGWEDQNAAVGQGISPLLAPEAAQNIANLTLMPEIVRDAHDPSPDAGTLELAQKLQGANIITRESLERINLLKLNAPRK